MDAQTGQAGGTNRKHTQQQNDRQRTKRPSSSIRNQRQKKRQQQQDVASKASDHSHPAISMVEIPPPGPKRTSSMSLDDLPTHVLRMMGDFAGIKTPFNDCCKRIIEAFHQLHYKINMVSDARFFARGFGVAAGLHMGLHRPEGLSGRSVTHITVAGCTDLKDSRGGYQLLEKAVAEVVVRSIPTLRSISVKGRRRRDSGRVAAILAGMVPRSTKLMKDRVAPRLTRVELAHGADGLAKIGKAISAGLWPALEELIIPSCHANQRHMNHVATALNAGHAPNLRALDWGHQAVGSALADSMLLPLANGKCPHLESLSFTDNFVLYDRATSNLIGALRACPKLRSLRMDCSMTPNNQLQDLITALHAGVAPKLGTLYVRCSSSYSWGSIQASPALVQEFLKAASSRRSEVHLDVKVVPF